MNTQNKKIIGQFFTVDGEKYVTMLDYRSATNFKKLLEQYSSNAKIYLNPSKDDEFKYIPLKNILKDADNKLKKQKINNLILRIMAQNYDI